jgi:hypothetical protein
LARHVAQIVYDPGSGSGVRTCALDPEHASAFWAKSGGIAGERFWVGREIKL